MTINAQSIQRTKEEHGLYVTTSETNTRNGQRCEKCKAEQSQTWDCVCRVQSKRWEAARSRRFITIIMVILLLGSRTYLNCVCGANN